MIGEQVGGWRIAELIGEGAQGTVYAARHVELGRGAAIKVLLPRLARNDVRVQRFFDEARAASSICHPGVVEVYDCGRDDAGRIYIAMERLTGETLHVRLRRSLLTLGEALTILRQLAEALGAAHAAGIVHRDLKPENVFLAHDCGEVRVKILDFGVAKLAPALRGGGDTLTGAGLLGTPPYMAPEQCSQTGAIDRRADLYAIGCLLHELVTGTPPFGFEGIRDLVENHLRAEPPPLSAGCPDVPDALDELAAALLAKNPAERPASCQEVIDAIDRIGLATPIEAAAPATVAPLAPTVIEPARGWRAAVWRKLLAVEPWVAAGVTCLVGACLLGLAIVCGVGDTYGSSNWGFTYIVLAPLIVTFELKTLQQCDATLRHLAARGMIRGRPGVDAAAVVRGASQRLGTGLVGFGTAVAIAAVALSVGEMHFRRIHLPVAGLWWNESALVGHVGAVCQGILIALILVFVVHAIAWSHLLHRLAMPRAPARLAIDRSSSDPRRGFEVLAGPIAFALIAGGLIQVTLYLSNLQHLAEVRHQSWLGAISPAGGLLDAGSGRYPSTTVLLASALVASFLIASGFLLWRAVGGAESDDRPRRLWPLFGLGPAGAAGLLALSFLCSLFFRLGPLWLVVVAAAAGRLARRPRTSSRHI